MSYSAGFASATSPLDSANGAPVSAVYNPAVVAAGAHQPVTVPIQAVSTAMYAPAGVGPQAGFAPAALMTPGGAIMPAAGASVSAGGEEEIRTLFVTGFPPDVNQRELHTLLRFFPGYEASQMSTKPAGTGASAAPQGFALFANQAYARQAMARINALAFDRDFHLRVELAHKNMYVKDDPTIYKADRVTAPVATGPTLATMAGLRPAAAMAMAAGYPAGAAHAALMGATPLGGFAPVTNRFDNMPCNTLFIGNLGDSVDEEELHMLFGTQPGFKQLKLIRNPRQVSCFVEYTDVAHAANVHNALQGAVLASSERGAIRVQYSKNPFGKRTNTPGMAPGASFLSGPGAGTGGMMTEFGWPGAFNLQTM